MNRSRVTGDLASHGNIFVDIANDRVGIGSTIPAKKLDVRGTSRLGGFVDFSDTVRIGDQHFSQTIASNQGVRINRSGSRPCAITFDHGGSPTLELGCNTTEAIIGSNSNLSKSLVIKTGMTLGTLTGGTTRFEFRSNGDIRMPVDNQKLQLGASQDLYLYHDGSNSYVRSDATNSQIIIRSPFVTIQDGVGNNQLISRPEAEVELKYDGSQRFETTAYGVNVTGTTDTDGLVVSGISTFSNNVRLLERDKLQLGNSQEFQIYYGLRDYNNTDDHAVIRNSTGNLYIQEDSHIVFETPAGSDMASMSAGDAVKLFFNGTQKFQTTNTGITVAGTVVATGADINGDIDVDGHTELDNVRITGIVTASNATISGNQILGHGNSTGNQIKFTRSGLGDELVIGTDGYGNSTQYEATIQSSIVTARPLVFATNNTERLRIEGGGDLQLNNADSVIHTSADTSRLRIFGGSSNSTANGAALALHGVNHSSGNYAVLASGNGGFIRFSTGATPRLQITSDGNITFGHTSSPSGQTSAAIKYISGGRDFWDGTKGDYRALRIRIYDNGGNIDDQYGMGVSNGQLEIQSQGTIGFYASGAGSNTGRRVHAMTIDTGQKLLLGLTSARTNFFNAAATHVPRFQIESTNNDIGRAAIGLVYGKTNDSGPYITLAKHRSNTVGANTVVQENDETGIISFQGSDGSEFLESARIQAFIDGTPGSNNMPGRLVFRTTASGDAATIERVRITNTGAVTISGNRNQTAPTTYDDLTGTNQAGLLIGSSGITDAGIMLRTGTSGAGRIYFGDNSGSDAGRKQGQIIYHNNGDYMSFAANGSERFRITSDGSSYFGPQIITEANLRWGHDANQRPYVFSGATGSNPADATIIAANPNTDPSATRLGGFGFGCVTSSASGVGNSGLKAVIEGVTNANVSDAWKTGARIRFLVRPDNGNLGEVFSCNSDGTIDQIANLTSNITLLRLKNARTRASGNKYGMEFRDSSNEANANIVIQQNSSGNNAAHMDFYTNGGTGGNGVENGNHTLRLKQGGDVAIPTGNIEFRDLSSSPAQAAPASINMGGTHSNAAGNGTNLNAKLKVWSDGNNMMGMSVSSNQLDFILTESSYDYVWYAGNSGTTQLMRLEGTGNLSLYNGNKLNIHASSIPETHALINLGHDGGTNVETRAIDIDGGWSGGENKSISFTHGLNASNLVGQINSVHNGPGSSLRFGKLYHGADTSTYHMTLDSTSTTTADLNLKGRYRSTEHPAFSLDADGGQSDIGTTATKITYSVPSTIGRNQSSCYDTTNDRFVAPVDGMYHFYARHWFRPNATGTVTLLLYRNGAQIKESRFSSQSNGDYNTVQLSTTIFLSASNYIEVYGVSSSGSNFHVSSGSFHTEFSGFMVC